MNNCCNLCHQPDCCGGCSAPCPEEHFSIEADPYDSQTWWINGTKVRVPKIAETCTTLSTDFSGATLNYAGECGKDIITGRQLGQIIKLDDLRDVEAEHPDNCSMLVWNPHCDYCAEGCTSVGAAWEPYHIPDAGDCVMEPDDNGYYHILKKTDCGCITECKMPVVPAGAASLNFIRDSVPDDPDFPWYYGCYNDTINLHLEDNAPEFFGKFKLKVTINYGVQAIKSDKMPENYHFTSRVVPVVQDDSIRMTTDASILDGWAMAATTSTNNVNIPWGTTSLRGSMVVIVPKGKELRLYHEMRIRTNSSFGNQHHGYDIHPEYDGKEVTETGVNQALYPATRLNALQVLIEPIQGANDRDPVKDPDRSQLDAPVDVYPPLT
jgi:hypothetical protein